MRMMTAACAAALSLAFIAGADAQSAGPSTPTPRPPPGLGQPPGPGPGDVLPSPAPATPGAPRGGAPATPRLGQTPTTPDTDTAPKIQFTRAQQLDQLFILLKAAPNTDTAKAVEKRIS